jgi:hypothetical protein
MRKLVLPLLAFSTFLLASCTHLRTFKTYEDINTVSKDRKAQIILVNGRGYEGRDFHLAEDSTQWRDLNTNKAQSISTSEIREISIKNSGRGAWEGFGLGLLAGAATGAVIGFASGDDPGANGHGFETLFAHTAGEKALVYDVVTGGGGGLLGVVIGSSTGSKDKFVLQGEK